MRHFIQTYKGRERTCMAWLSVDTDVSYIQLTENRTYNTETFKIQNNHCSVDEILNALTREAINHGYTPIDTKPRIVNVLLS